VRIGLTHCGLPIADDGRAFNPNPGRAEPLCRREVSVPIIENDNSAPRRPVRKLIDLPEVMRRTGIKKTKLYDMMSSGEFPSPAKVGTRALWCEQEVDEWIRRQLESRPC
jgi:prophage regulatory protein